MRVSIRRFTSRAGCFVLTFALFTGVLAAVPADATGSTSISGTVTTAVGGAPVSGICVGVYSNGVGVGAVTTAADGTYTVQGLTPGSYAVEFFGGMVCGNYVTQWYNGTAAGASSLSGSHVVTVTVASPTTGIDAVMVVGATISGTVTTAVGGAPVSGACVEALSNGVAVGVAITLADGSYTVIGLASGSYAVSFSASSSCGATNLATQYYDGTTSGAQLLSGAHVVTVTVASPAIGINAVMVPGTTISGTVTSAVGGAPVSGICVFASSNGELTSSTATTAADGTYTLRGLWPGSYTVDFLTDSFSPCNANFVAQWYNGTTAGSVSSAGAAAVVATVASPATSINAVLVAGSLVDPPVTTPPAPSPTYYAYKIVLNGATLYSGPGTNYADVGSLANGSAIEMVCQARGTSIGVSHPTTWWDLLSTGSWVSDYYANTPVLDGRSIKQCTASQIPAVPTNTATAPTYYAYKIVLAGVSLYSGPGTSYTNQGSLANGSAIEMVCQTRGTSIGVAHPTAWWDLLSTGSWVSDYYVNTPVLDGRSITQCTASQIPAVPKITAPITAVPVRAGASTSLGGKIISIARSQNGVVQTSLKCAGAYGCTGSGAWCALFVSWVWKHAGARTTGLTPAVSTFVSFTSRTYTWHPDRGHSNVPQVGFTPQPGDAIVWAYGGVVQHVGIVNAYGGSLRKDYSINGNWLIPGRNPNLYTSWDVNVDTYADSAIASANPGWYVYGYAVPRVG